jgi:hypothetical protein
MSKAAVEPDRISLRWVWGNGIGFLAGIIVCWFVARGMMNGAATGEPLYAAAPPRASAEIGVVEQTLIRDSRRGLDDRASQQRELTRWGWVDQEKGIARIPIERAMDLAVDPDFLRRAQAGAPPSPIPGPP